MSYPITHEDLGLTAVAPDVYRLDGAMVYTVPSDSDERGRYRVVYWKHAGSWDCTCRGFFAHRHCKHVNRVREIVS